MYPWSIASHENILKAIIIIFALPLLSYSYAIYPTTYFWSHGTTFLLDIDTYVEFKFSWW
jgi:hypothetical protein